MVISERLLISAGKAIPRLFFATSLVDSLGTILLITYLIYRRAVELVESQQRLKHSPSPQPMRVTLSHVASVISDVYGSGVTASNQDAFPLQQKLVLCTLLLMVRGRTVKELTLGKLHEAYVKVCRHKQLKNESECEFVGLCSMLETRGVVSIKKAKETRLMKVF